MRAVDELLRSFGLEPAGELAETAERVAEAWDEDLLAGQGVDLAARLGAGALDLGDGPHGIVGLRGISVATMCPHHLMPSHGSASVAFAPVRRGAGLGALADLVRTAGQRLVLQETLGADVARALVRALGARGALCRLELVHTCLAARGEREASAVVDTVAFAGAFEPGGELHGAALAWLGERRSPASAGGEARGAP
jgi:GTP cyclohydrolase I